MRLLSKNHEIKKINSIKTVPPTTLLNNYIATLCEITMQASSDIVDIVNKTILVSFSKYGTSQAPHSGYSFKILNTCQCCSATNLLCCYKIVSFYVEKGSILSPKDMVSLSLSLS